MAEINPPGWLQGGPAAVEHPAALWRLASLAPFDAAGILSAGALEVTAGPALAVTVTEGDAIVPGTVRPYQGHYYCASDGPVERSIAVPDATNPRRDLVIAVVHDAHEAGVDDEWEIDRVTGVAGATPTDPTIPDNAIALARVHVPADPTATWTPSAGDLDDLRTPATIRPLLLATTVDPSGPDDLTRKGYVDDRRPRMGTGDPQVRSTSPTEGSFVNHSGPNPTVAGVVGAADVFANLPVSVSKGPAVGKTVIEFRLELSVDGAATWPHTITGTLEASADVDNNQRPMTLERSGVNVTGNVIARMKSRRLDGEGGVVNAGVLPSAVHVYPT